MSIRLIAKELYRLQQEVEALEGALGAVPAAERPVLEDRLRKTRAEQQRIRAMLEGAKEPPPYRRAR